MSKNEIREQLVELGFDDSILLENPDYDSAIIGYDENSGRVIYDHEKMVKYLMNNEDMSYDEAIDFIGYNTIRATPYMGENAPIILRNFEFY